MTTGPKTSPKTSIETSYLDSLEPGSGVLVGGRWRPGTAGVFAVENPATRELVADVADGSTEDATAAVDAAAAALPEWSALPPRTRSDLLSRVRDLML
ncbi:aldehyde dehydrogenase family protein, partial [Nocardioides sp. NPDC000441]